MSETMISYLYPVGIQMAHLQNQVQKTMLFILRWCSMITSDPDYIPSVFPHKKTDDEEHDTSSRQRLSSVVQL